MYVDLADGGHRVGTPGDSGPLPGNLPRRLGPVPWYHDGFDGLAAEALPSVPPSDDSMIRAALVRGALSSRTMAELERALNRELWQIGYTARIQRDPANLAVMRVEISMGY